MVQHSSSGVVFRYTSRTVLLTRYSTRSESALHREALFGTQPHMTAQPHMLAEWRDESAAEAAGSGAAEPPG